MFHFAAHTKGNGDANSVGHDTHTQHPTPEPHNTDGKMKATGLVQSFHSKPKGKKMQNETLKCLLTRRNLVMAQPFSYQSSTCQKTPFPAELMDHGSQSFTSRLGRAISHQT